MPCNKIIAKVIACVTFLVVEQVQNTPLYGEIVKSTIAYHMPLPLLTFYYKLPPFQKIKINHIKKNREYGKEKQNVFLYFFHRFFPQAH